MRQNRQSLTGRTLPSPLVEDADPGDLGAPGGAGGADASDAGEVERLLADLAVWTGEQRARAAADARGRRRWMHQQATESATFVGALIDLGERRTPVAVRTVSGRMHSGTVDAIGRDFVAIGATIGQRRAAILLALTAVASVRTSPETRGGRGALDAGPPTGDRAARRAVTLAQTLAAVSIDRPLVRVAVRGDDDVVVGELRAMGGDVLTVRIDGRPPAHVYFALASLEECTVFGSG